MKRTRTIPHSKTSTVLGRKSTPVAIAVVVAALVVVGVYSQFVTTHAASMTFIGKMSSVPISLAPPAGAHVPTQTFTVYACRKVVSSTNWQVVAQYELSNAWNPYYGNWKNEMVDYDQYGGLLNQVGPIVGPHTGSAYQTLTMKGINPNINNYLNFSTTYVPTSGHGTGSFEISFPQNNTMGVHPRSLATC